jgi:hypothetical protein
LQCPDDFGWTAKNTLTVVYRYGVIWFVWIFVNRFLRETLLMSDSLLNFAQLCGVLGAFDLNWPANLGAFFSVCGLLDFDVDVTTPGCVVSWSWTHDMILQLSMPLVVGLVNVLECAILSVCWPTQDPEAAKFRRATAISKYLNFVNCLYMTLVRYTVAAFVCMDLTDDGFQVCPASRALRHLGLH